MAEKWLIAMPLPGGGSRRSEALRRRIKDICFERVDIAVCEGKGDKDRVTMLPKAVTC